ncbi:MAG: hypothetical protein P8I93_03990 [Crocinitomicaceae bacterium]|nr:hypothetical protein [Crocinitomicaceae bacterium]
MHLSFSFILAFFLLLSSNGLSQKIKWKYRGEYVGIIPAYSFHSGNEYIEVEKTDIQIKLRKREIEITIGKNIMKGDFEIVKEENKTLYINFKRPKDYGTEKIIVSRKKREIIRDSFYPQPKCILHRTKKRRIYKKSA